MNYRLALILWLFLGCTLLRAETQPIVKKWDVEGVERQALVFLASNPAEKGKKTPVVFAFHGHGGTMNHASRSFGIHRSWPEAIVVYPQGLNTPGQLTDPEGKRPGWQKYAGDQGDRDLKLYDAMLESLKKYHQADDGKVFSTGHSNGGGFTYLLWSARGNTLAAVAPSAAVFLPKRGQLSPKPVLHLAGWNDDLVKYAWQEKMMSLLLRVNHCRGDAMPWPVDKRAHTYAIEDNGKTTVFYIHGHEHAWVNEGGKLVTDFFKSCLKTNEG